MLSKVASDMGLKLNPKNLSDEELIRIKEQFIKEMTDDFDSIGLLFRRDLMRVEEYQAAMKASGDKHVRNFFQLVGEPRENDMRL